MDETLTMSVALKGRIHHHGDLTKTPYRIDRQSWNAHDENALIVYDADGRSLGFVDKEAAAMVSPLLRAGYFKDLHLQALDPSDDADDKRAEVLCNLTMILEPSRAQEFHSLANKIGPEKKTFPLMLQKARNPTEAIGNGGFVRASQLRPAKDDHSILEAYERLKRSISQSISETCAFPKKVIEKHISTASRKGTRLDTRPKSAPTIRNFFQQKQRETLHKDTTKVLDEVSSKNVSSIMHRKYESVVDRQPALAFWDVQKQFKVSEWFEIQDILCGLRCCSREWREKVDLEFPIEHYQHQKFYFTAMTTMQAPNHIIVNDIEDGFRVLTDPSLGAEDRSAWMKRRLHSSETELRLQAREAIYKTLGHFRQLSQHLGDDTRLSGIALARLDELYQQLHGQRDVLGSRRSSGNVTSVTLTPEQQLLMKARLHPGALVRVNAFAGAGKTSSLIQLTRTHPDKRFLYLCFNKSVQTEASKSFPSSNVECRTIHSLAFEMTGYRPYACVQTDDFDAVTRWLYSSQLSAISVDDAEEGYELRQTSEVLEQLRKYLNQSSSLAASDPLVIDLWNSMKDGRVPMTYSGVLKECALRRPKLHERFDVILLDEAQDCNPCALDIVLSQTECARVLVGDGHQAIYGFTDAKNALKLDIGLNIPFDQIQDYSLSRTFRFGPTLAAMVTSFLRNNGRKSLNGKPCTVIGSHSVGDTKIMRGADLGNGGDSFVSFYRKANQMSRERAVQCCFVARTNATCLEAMFEALQVDPSVKVRMIDGLQAARADELLEVAYLMEPPSSSSSSPLPKRSRASSSRSASFPSRFESIDAMYGACVARGLKEWVAVIRAAKRWGTERTIEIVNTLRKSDRVVNTANKADLLFSTVHRVKGLEFDGVYVANDFDMGDTFCRQHINGRTRWKSIDEESANLLYVAFTRAKRFLKVNRTIDSHNEAWLELVGAVPRFLKRSLSNGDGDGIARGSFTCGLCMGKNLGQRDSQWRLVPLFSKESDMGAWICSECESTLSQHFPSHDAQ